MRRGLIYGAVAGLAIGALPGIAALTAVFAGCLLGAGQGAAVRVERGQPPIVRATIWAGILGPLLGSVLGFASGLVLPWEIAWIYTLAAGVLAGIGAGLIAWQLVRRPRVE